MKEITAYKPGRFSWVDLATTDPAGAKTFYTGLFGWTTKDTPAGPDMVYTMFQLDGKDVCACSQLMKEQAAMGIPTHWNCYITVENVADSTAAAEQLGATVVMPPFDVMGAGRMSVLQDPTGAYIQLWEPLTHAGSAYAGEPGSMCWHELYTRDLDAAQAFYSKLLGWQMSKMEMGHGDYIIAADGPAQIAGMMAIMPEMGAMPPNWTVYFAVEDCEASCAKAESLGGKVFLPPMDVANVGRMAGICDPQGGGFMVIKLSM